jgi:hypothetical protein
MFWLALTPEGELGRVDLKAVDAVDSILPCHIDPNPANVDFSEISGLFQDSNKPFVR